MSKLQSEILGLALFVLFLAPKQSLWAFSPSRPVSSPSTSSPSTSSLGSNQGLTKAMPAGEEGITLSVALRDRLTGQSLDEPEKRAELSKLADEFVEFRKLKKYSPKRKAMIDHCQKMRDDFDSRAIESYPLDSISNPGTLGGYGRYEESHDFLSEKDALEKELSLLSNPFCTLIADVDQPQSQERGRGSRRERLSRLETRKAQRDWVQGHLDKLEGYSENTLVHALKTLPASKSISASIDAALAAPQCPSSRVLSILGLRVEHDLPDPAVKEKVMRLLTRAAHCGDDIFSLRAGYRLGLLHIWNRSWDEANRVLKPVSEDPLAIDLRQRAIYWRYYAALQLKDDSLRDQMQERLLREYPLSLHALFVGGGLSKVDRKILNPADPEVKFRSSTFPRVNATLAAAELLQERGEFQAATDLLSEGQEALKQAEAPVQLYATVLLMRSGEVLRKFKWMASLFHDNPALISQATLQMLYPLRRFDLIRAYETVIDPYLVISLIRQESAFNESARSGVGALGLMQIMPATASRLERHVSKRQLLDPTVNVRLGVKFFSRLLEEYDGDVELALAAYNAGKDRVDEWKKRYSTDNRLLFIDLMPFRETREYVASIARNYYWYLRLYDQVAFKQKLMMEPPPIDRGALLPVTTTTASPAPVSDRPAIPSPRHFSVFSQFLHSELPPNPS